MPVYQRKNVAWTPPSLMNESFALEDSDFIQDPDQTRDVLPQPYRLIDKILWSLVDDVYEELSHREADRIFDASRFRPPQYVCAVMVEEEGCTAMGQAECMVATPDGRYVVMGLHSGLGVILAETQQVVDLLSEDNLHISQVEAVMLGSDAYLLTTIDDMGCARLYGLAGDHLYPLSTVNEPDSANKTVVSKCETSPGGDYLAVLLEKPSAQEQWLEIHRLPRDAWIKDLENLLSKASSQITLPPGKAPTPTVEEMGAPLDSGRSAESATAADVTASNADRLTANTSLEDPRAQSAASHRPVDRSSHKFTASTVLMKVLPPAATTVGTTYSNLQQAFKALDHSGDVVGTGLHHLLSPQHLDQRLAAFKNLHQDSIGYLPDPQPGPRDVTVHFLQPGRFFPVGSESSNPTVGVVALWWNSTSQLLLYSLNKQAKDLERKPDFVLPLSAPISVSSVSSDGSQLALVLANNSLIVWDIHLGLPKGVLQLSSDGKAMSVHFLLPGICPQDNIEYPPYPMATTYYIMVVMDNGQVFLVNASHMGDSPTCLDLNIVRDHEVPTLCEPVAGIPDLILTCRQDGRVYLHDVHQGKQLCEISLPSDYELTSPWQPLICVGGKGRMLYLEGQLKSPPEQPAAALETPQDQLTDPPESRQSQLESHPDQLEPQEEQLEYQQGQLDEGDDDTAQQVEQPQHQLFVFQLRSFPALDKYRNRECQDVPFSVHTPATARVDCLLRERLGQQGVRVSRMQQRWSQLKEELELLQNLRSRNSHVERNTYSVSTIAKSPLLGKFL